MKSDTQRKHDVNAALVVRPLKGVTRLNNTIALCARRTPESIEHRIQLVLARRQRTADRAVSGLR